VLREPRSLAGRGARTCHFVECRWEANLSERSAKQLHSNALSAGLANNFTCKRHDLLDGNTAESKVNVGLDCTKNWCCRLTRFRIPDCNERLDLTNTNRYSLLFGLLPIWSKHTYIEILQLHLPPSASLSASIQSRLSSTK